MEFFCENEIRFLGLANHVLLDASHSFVVHLRA